MNDLEILMLSVIHSRVVIVNVNEKNANVYLSLNTSVKDHPHY